MSRQTAGATGKGRVYKKKTKLGRGCGSTIDDDGEEAAVTPGLRAVQGRRRERRRRAPCSRRLFCCVRRAHVLRAGGWLLHSGRATRAAQQHSTAQRAAAAARMRLTAQTTRDDDPARLRAWRAAGSAAGPTHASTAPAAGYRPAAPPPNHGARPSPRSLRRCSPTRCCAAPPPFLLLVPVERCLSLPLPPSIDASAMCAIERGVPRLRHSRAAAAQPATRGSGATAVMCRLAGTFFGFQVLC